MSNYYLKFLDVTYDLLNIVLEVDIDEETRYVNDNQKKEVELEEVLHKVEKLSKDMDEMKQLNIDMKKRQDRVEQLLIQLNDKLSTTPNE